MLLGDSDECVSFIIADEFTIKIQTSTNQLYMKIYETSNVEIVYRSDDKQILQTWTDFVPSDMFRAAIDQTVAFAQHHPVEVIVSDTQKQNAIAPDDSEYAALGLPELKRAGVRAMAFVIPENLFTKLSLKRFASVDKTDMLLQYFGNMDEAQAWIKTCVG